MKCNEVRDIVITDYVDGELDTGAKREIDLHLQGCASCRQFMEAVMAAAVAPLRGAQTAVPPPWLWQRIASGLERKPARHEGILSLLRPAWANALVMASMLAFSLFAGNYFARDIWSSPALSGETVEMADSLGLNTLGDMPANQVETAYTAIVGG